MMTAILLLVLTWSFYIGYSRGLVLQIYYVFSVVLSAIIAAGFYKKLAALFDLWVPFANATQGSGTYYFDSKYLFDLDQVFYAGLAFVLIFTAVYAAMRLLGIFMHLLEFVSPDTVLFNSISGVLSVAVTAFVLQMVLTLLATIPMTFIQDKLHASFLANYLIEQAPITSSLLKQLWLTQIVG